MSAAHRNEDGQSPAWEPAFVNSRWFTRGRTLQEILAPTVVEFFSRDGVCLGNRLELKSLIHDITDVPLAASSGTHLDEVNVDERLSWAVGRQTTRKEDEVYALLGIFNIKMPFIYAEGYVKVLRRLLNELNDLNAATVSQDSQAKCIARSTVPFRRDKDFICRDSLGAIRRVCERPAGCAALIGLGGVGQVSQPPTVYIVLTKESANLRLPSNMPTFYWVQADIKERLREGYLNIAKKVRIDGGDDTKSDFVQLVNRWLCNEANGRWVMVIDSANDWNVFLHDTPASCAAYNTGQPPFPTIPPRSSTDSILITSRSREVAGKLTCTESSIVEVGPMTYQDAFALLQKKFSFALERPEADALISAMDHMPLALTQAAAFINRT